jgi:glucose/mannose-6-phosphate isomerase
MKRGDYNQLVFCGIGGSAFPGEFVESLDLDVPVLAARESLPNSADRNTLCFIVSYSGNTKETIDLYRQAKKRKCKIVIVTSGGKLSKVREKRFMVPKGYIPREAFMHLTFPVLDFLGIRHESHSGIAAAVSNKEVGKIVRQIKGKTPIIYGSSESLRFIAYRWQTFFNENCKILAHSNYFPEVLHNEIEGRSNKNFQAILLVDKKTRLLEASNKYIRAIEVKLKGKDLVSKMLYGTYIGYLVSYELAKSMKVDYRETKRIDSLKKIR